MAAIPLALAATLPRVNKLVVSSSRQNGTYQPAYTSAPVRTATSHATGVFGSATPQREQQQRRDVDAAHAPPHRHAATADGRVLYVGPYGQPAAGPTNLIDALVIAANKALAPWRGRAPPPSTTAAAAQAAALVALPARPPPAAPRRRGPAPILLRAPVRELAPWHGAPPPRVLAAAAAGCGGSGGDEGRRTIELPASWGDGSGNGDSSGSPTASRLVPGDAGLGFWFDGMTSRGNGLAPPPPTPLPSSNSATAAAAAARYARAGPGISGPRAAAAGWAAALVLGAAAAALLLQTWLDERRHPAEYHRAGPDGRHAAEPEAWSSPTLLTAEALPSAPVALFSRARGGGSAGGGVEQLKRPTATASGDSAGSARLAARERALSIAQLEAALARLTADEAAARAALARAEAAAAGGGGVNAGEPARQLRGELASLAVLTAALRAELRGERAAHARASRGGG